jgi:uncharacterized membrane-anchored protein YitT (DUF2179 family)
MIHYLNGVKIMKEKSLNLIQILLGNACIAFAVNTLILEHGIICGGVSGLASAVEHYWGLPLSWTVAILNIALFFLGLKSFGKEFAMSILISTFSFPIFLDLFDRIPAFHNYLDDSLLAMVIGGCIVGFGIGLVIRAKASTGGVEILAQFIHKQFKKPVHLVLNIIDVLILLFQITYSDTTHIIYGIILTFVSSAVLNKTLLAGRSLIQLTIISDHHEEMRDIILHDMDAGVTMLMSEKGYTHENSKLLMTIIPYAKLPIIKSKILAIDPLAFIVVSKVDEVGGMGFTVERKYD